MDGRWSTWYHSSSPTDRRFPHFRGSSEIHSSETRTFHGRLNSSLNGRLDSSWNGWETTIPTIIYSMMILLQFLVCDVVCRCVWIILRLASYDVDDVITGLVWKRACFESCRRRSDCCCRSILHCNMQPTQKSWKQREPMKHRTPLFSL